ncbi:MAG: extracellular solute-binding protein [Bacillota bacterium]|nr:MAG: hypothetical protein DIU70_01440 [Bacillota bacterium]
MSRRPAHPVVSAILPRALPVALGLLLLAGCTRLPERRVPATPAPVAGGSADVISIRVLGGDSPALDAHIAAFYEAYPHYRVRKLRPPPGVGWGEFARLHIQEGNVDVIAGPSPALVAEGLLLPLDPLVQASGFDLGGLGEAVDQLREAGQLYALPYAASPVVVAYNRERFASAGVPLPRPGWTWEEFREAAARTARAGGEGYWGFVTDEPALAVQLWLEGRTGGRWETAGEAEVREALAFFHSLVFSDGAVPPVPAPEDAGRSTGGTGAGGGGSVPAWEVFFAGRAAMILADLTFLLSQSRGPGLRGGALDWDVAPLPVHPGEEPVIWAAPFLYGIAATSPQPEAAWNFVRFAAGPEGAVAMARAGYLPLYRSPEVRAAWFEQQPAPPPGTETLFTGRWSLAGGGQASAAETWRILHTATARVLSGASSPAEAAAAFRAEMDQVLAGAGAPSR